MKIALCQMNSIIADFKNNSNTIINHINNARNNNVDIIVFPELILSGYPPLDLIDNRDFIIQNDEFLNLVLENTQDITVILGAINKTDNKLYNAAFVFSDKKVLYIQNKTLLPNYDVFDEKRYFVSNDSFDTFKVKNKKFAVLICEDIWFDIYKDRYNIDPVEKVSAQTPEFLIVIAASPFSKNKLNKRIEICKKIVSKTNIPLFYLNSVGAQDEIIFDGNSFAVYKNNVEMLKSFEEDVRIFDLDNINKIKNNYIIKDNIEYIYKALVLGIKDYFSKIGISKAVIGLSGGVDSAVVTPLAVKALGKDNVTAIIMPSIYSADSSVSDAKKLAENLNILYYVISIDELFNLYKSSLSSVFNNAEEDVTEENIQSRIRGNILMAVANKSNAMVLTTGNKSEFSMGYATLYGDLIGSVAALGDLLKREVYQLGRYINEISSNVIPENIFLKAPSAELKFNQKDEDTLPRYEILDEVLFLHIEKGYIKNEIISSGFDEKTVNEIFHKLYRQEFKRKQSPIVLKISDKNFGIGRRIPVTNRFF